MDEDSLLGLEYYCTFDVVSHDQGTNHTVIVTSIGSAYHISTAMLGSMK